MKLIEGRYASAVVLTDEAEDYALAQIKQLCDQEAFQGSRIRVMPDVHPGKVGTIGFTATVTNKVMPAVVGIDIGCGMTIAKVKKGKREFQRLDAVIRDNVPSGFGIRVVPHRFSERFDMGGLRCREGMPREDGRDKALLSMGTLGGGNHFIEVDEASDGGLYVLVHSGSRSLGKMVSEYYMREGQRELKSQGIQIPYELVYLEGRLMEDYLYDTALVQIFAALNREAILDEILQGMKWKPEEEWSCIHNYVAFDKELEAPVLRKGAISAHLGERVIIPVNMRDGVLLGIGRGNAEWNYSAPHGAGRLMSREMIRKNYTVSQFKKEMKGVYSTCVSADTLDEAPFAYRSLGYLKEAVAETVEITEILKPVYNFKAGGT